MEKRILIFSNIKSNFIYKKNLSIYPLNCGKNKQKKSFKSFSGETQSYKTFAPETLSYEPKAIKLLLLRPKAMNISYKTFAAQTLS